MPEKCIHMEKIEKSLNLFKVVLEPEWNSGWGSLWWNWSIANDENSKKIRDFSCVTRMENKREFGVVLRDAEHSLNGFKKQLLSIANECNCEEKNNQQLVLQRNTESDLSIVRAGINKLQVEKESLERENSRLGDLIKWGEGRLQKTENERDDFKNKWISSDAETKRITIESSNKDQEIENKSRDVEELKGLLEVSQEESLNYRFRTQENRLETFIQKLGINRTKVRDLQKAYYQLIKSRENYNQENINEASETIEQIKDELLRGGWFTWKVSVENTQELCLKCEEVAKLRIEQEKLYQRQYQERQNQQQQYQAQQEQPTNN